MGGRGASSSTNSVNQKEIQAVYDYVNNKGAGRGTGIGANTKAYKYALNNATDVRVYNRDTGTMDTATRQNLKNEVERFGTGKYGWQMWKSGEDEFTLYYSSNDFYTFKLKRRK